MHISYHPIYSVVAHAYSQRLALRIALYSSSHEGLRSLPSFPTRRSSDLAAIADVGDVRRQVEGQLPLERHVPRVQGSFPQVDRKSTRLNSSHGYNSYAVFCLKKKKRSSVLSTGKLSCLGQDYCCS